MIEFPNFKPFDLAEVEIDPFVVGTVLQYDQDPELSMAVVQFDGVDDTSTVAFTDPSQLAGFGQMCNTLAVALNQTIRGESTEELEEHIASGEVDGVVKLSDVDSFLAEFDEPD